MSTDATTVSRAELSRDPYPAYRRLRDQGACVWLEAAGRYVVPRWEDVVVLNDRPGITAREVVSTTEPVLTGRNQTDADASHCHRAPTRPPVSRACCCSTRPWARTGRGISSFFASGPQAR